MNKDIWLIWELNPHDKTQCLRAVDEDEVVLLAHLRSLRLEAAMNGGQSKFFSEKNQTNHLYGHNDMKAASIVIRNAGR